MPEGHDIHVNFKHTADPQVLNIKVLSNKKSPYDYASWSSYVAAANNSNQVNGFRINVLVGCTNPDSGTDQIACAAENIPK